MRCSIEPSSALATVTVPWGCTGPALGRSFVSGRRLELEVLALQCPGAGAGTVPPGPAPCPHAPTRSSTTPILAALSRVLMSSGSHQKHRSQR
jgi:hypothetical protein